MFKFFGRGRRLQTLSGEKQKVPWEAESRKAADYSGFLHLVLKKKRKKLEKKKRLVTYSISSVTWFFISQQINCAETLDSTPLVIEYYSTYGMETLSRVWRPHSA